MSARDRQTEDREVSAGQIGDARRWRARLRRARGARAGSLQRSPRSGIRVDRRKADPSRTPSALGALRTRRRASSTRSLGIRRSGNNSTWAGNAPGGLALPDTAPLHTLPVIGRKRRRRGIPEGGAVGVEPEVDDGKDRKSVV